MHTNSVGARIKSARERLHLTQAELGARLVPPVDQTYVSRWEQDKVEPRGGTRLRLAQALGVSAEWIRTGTDAAENAVDRLSGQNPVRSNNAFRDFLPTLGAICEALQSDKPIGNDEKKLLLSLLDNELSTLLNATDWEIPPSVSSIDFIKIIHRIYNLSEGNLPKDVVRKIAKALAEDQALSNREPSDHIISSFINVASHG